MAKCLKCDCVYAVYGGSEGSKCPICNSKKIDTSMEKKDNELEYGLSGYLAPDGKWFSCGYQEHGNLAKELMELYNLDTSDSNNIAMKGDFIKFGTVPWAKKDGTDMCHVFMNTTQEPTKEQVVWLDKNLINATDEQAYRVLSTFYLHYKSKLKYVLDEKE